MNPSRIFRQPNKVRHALYAIGALAASFAITSVPALADDSKQLGKTPVAIAIHGGAGTILKSSMTPEKEADYKRVLTQAVQHGYA
ncbi:MAG: beta-aspartyl-peptidase (threonine type), partial [Alteromonas macleodii]